MTSRRPQVLRTISLCTLLAAATGCERTPGDPHWFPLEPGRVWQYRVERTTMDGTRALRHVVHSARVPADSGLAGLRRTLDGRRLRYVRTAQGLFRIDAHGDRELVLPPAPAALASWQGSSTTSVLENTGPPWETLFRINVPVALRYTVTSTDASVETPAGHFEDCLLVEGRGSASADVGNYIGRAAITVETREWFARDVGLLRLEREERTDAAALSGGRLVMELDAWRGE
ncbi:MAG: hypothetical protein RLW62_10345 [Gammaproteobacteria bacterium]